MTQREFLEMGIKLFEEVNMPDMVEYAKGRITQLDKKNSSRASKMTKTQIENEEIKKEIVKLFEENPNLNASASEIGENLEISTSKASALLRQLVNSEILASTEIRVKGKGKRQFYSLIHR